MERLVINSIFMSRDCASKVFSELDEECFSYGAWKNVFTAANKVYAKTGSVDVGLVLADLKDVSSATLMHAVSAQPKPVPSNVPGYCQKLLEYAEAREVWRRAELAMWRSSEYAKDGEIDVVREAASGVAGAAARADSRKGTTLAGAVNSYIEKLFNPQMIRGIRTGLPTIDRKMRGLAAGRLVVLGARRGVGKTAVGMRMIFPALERGQSVVWIAQEMSAEEVAGRFVHMHSKVDSKEEYLSGEHPGYNAAEREAIEEARAAVSNYRLTIYDKPVDPDRLWPMARSWAAEGKMDALAIDYLQILKFAERSGEKEHQAIGRAVRISKHIAQEYKAPVLALAQCRRESDEKENTQNKRIFMSNFKGSGAIEEHADQAILLWPGDLPKRIQGEIAKNRHGSTGLFELEADFANMQIEELQQQQQTGPTPAALATPAPQEVASE